MTTDAETKPTHRCPRCGGASVLEGDDPSLQLTARHPPKTVPCPVCTPWGPFGLVPEVVAIEAVLTADVSPVELEMRQLNNQRSSTVAWLLEDKPATCGKCDGTGVWQNPYNKRDKRACFACDGKGTLL